VIDYPFAERFDGHGFLAQGRRSACSDRRRGLGLVEILRARFGSA